MSRRLVADLRRPRRASGRIAWSGAITGVTVYAPENREDGTTKSYVSFDAVSFETKTLGQKFAIPTESRLRGSKSSPNILSKYDPRAVSSTATCQPRFPRRPAEGKPWSPQFSEPTTTFSESMTAYFAWRNRYRAIASLAASSARNRIAAPLAA